MVIVDSNVWIDYLRKPSSESGEALTALLLDDRVAIAGPILAEVLQGARSPTELDRVLELMEPAKYLETGRESWVRAGAIAMNLRLAGQTTPLMDLVIAATALNGNHELFTFDEDFQRVPELRLYDWRDPNA